MLPGGKYLNNTSYTEAGRDHFVREIFEILRVNPSKYTLSIFNELVRYLRWMDENKIMPKEGDYLHKDLVNAYMLQFSKWVKKGIYKKGSWTISKNSLSFILKKMGREDQARSLPSIRGRESDVTPYSGLHLESELKPVIRAIIKSYYSMEESLKIGLRPAIHPLYDKELFDKQCIKEKLSPDEITHKLAVFKKAVSCKGDWRNQISRLAIMICFFFTGMNTTALLRIKRSEIKFKQINGGKFIIESFKTRAGGKTIDNSLGFSKTAKKFIENWLITSSLITGNSPSAPLFPYIKRGGVISSYLETTSQPQFEVNKLLKLLGLRTLNSSVLRKTKIDTLLKVTEDIILVSNSSNNTLSTLSKSYSSGLERDHENNLGSAMQAQYDIARGEDIKQSITKAKFDYHDILSEYDYKNLMKNKNQDAVSITPMGVRCINNKGGIASKIGKVLKNQNVSLKDNEMLCTDFLSCFDCENHQLVASVNDIWLMLSFKETIEDMRIYPSLNSIPDARFNKIEATITSILEKFENLSPKNYKEANNLLKKSSHPLYSNKYSLTDLLGVFSW